jgi:hypothetical protein
MDGIVGHSRPEHFRTLGYHDGPFIFSSFNDAAFHDAAPEEFMTKFWSIIFVLLLAFGGAQLQAQTDPKSSGRSGSSTISKEWLSGSWLARDGSKVFLLEVLGNGVYTWKIAKWNGEVVYSETAKWELVNERLKQTWKSAQSGLTEVAFYELERISDDTVRWRGGNFGLNTILFHRVKANQLLPLSGWLVGTWTTLAGFESYTFELQADGRLAFNKEAGLTSQAESGEGNWTFEKGILTFTGDVPGTYNVRPYDDVSFNATTAANSSGLLFKRSNAEPRDPFKTLNFAGQYIQQDTTMTITGKGEAYTAKLLVQGNSSTLTGRATGDTLELSDANGKVLYQLRLDNNGLRNTNLYQISNKFYLKVAENTLNTPNKLVGYWLRTKGFSQDDDLLLLPDGRYRQTAHYELAGSTSISIAEGLYKMVGGKITLDPSCAGPSTYALKQVQNHLLTSFTSGFDGKEIISTYMAAPASSIEYQLAQVKIRDALEAQINEQWMQKIALGKVNLNIGRIPPTSEISLDPNPNDVFANSSVFAENQLYPYQSEAFYYYDFDGNFRSTTLGMMILDKNIAGTINSSRGQYHDKLNTYFFPNGRMMTYFESYLTAKSIAYPPQPTQKFSWNKYRIQGEKIIVGEGKNALTYDLINGRRHIRQGEQCFENLKFSTSLIRK